MKSLIASIVILGLVGMVVGVVAQGAQDTAGVTATVSPGVIAVSVSPVTVDYGVLALSTSDSDRSTTESGTITATNDGNITSDFTIKGDDMSGLLPNKWTLNSSPPTTGTVGLDEYAHRFDEGTTFTDAEAAALDSTTYKTLKTGVVDAGTADFVLEMNMPTSSTDTEVKWTTVTILATES